LLFSTPEAAILPQLGSRRAGRGVALSRTRRGFCLPNTEGRTAAAAQHPASKRGRGRGQGR
jgi:hypothetical protein